MFWWEVLWFSQGFIGFLVGLSGFIGFSIDFLRFYGRGFTGEGSGDFLVIL